MLRRSLSALLGAAICGHKGTEWTSFSTKAPWKSLLLKSETEAVTSTVFQKCPARNVASMAAAGRNGNPVWLPESIHPRQAFGLVAWLGMSTFGVGSLIVLGGITRLTRSGLSMTEWKFTGERPPLTASDWQIEFDKYKQSPEFHKVNKNISLEDFKFIYWMEYAHRMWGRCLGVVFGLPAIYFVAKRTVTSHLAKRIALLMLMGGTQGLVGWWMVKSGLEEPENETAVPRVSPYRLAAHLTSAFAIYSLLLWTTQSVRTPVPLLWSSPIHVQQASARLRRWLIPLGGLIGMTALSGAFVAGNDAGRSYNTFPKMNGSWIPEEYFSQPLFSRQHLFQNTAAVQLHHRIMALTTTICCLSVFAKSRKMELHPTTKQHLLELAGMAIGQVTLGVFALLNYVPTWLGSAHQAGALILMSLILGSIHTLRPVQPTKISQALSHFGPGVAAAGVLGVGALLTRIN